MVTSTGGRSVVCACEMCKMAGVERNMVAHTPLPHHYYCTTCGNLWINWAPIMKRVERQILKPYIFARFRILSDPSAPIAAYGDVVHGGQAISQQESYVIAKADDIGLVAFVNTVCKDLLSTEERHVIDKLYFEAWPAHKVASLLNLAERTVYNRRDNALKAFARAKGWA